MIAFLKPDLSAYPTTLETFRAHSPLPYTHSAAAPHPHQHAEKLQARRLLLVGSAEWERGCVVVRDLDTFQQVEMPVAELVG